MSVCVFVSEGCVWRSCGQNVVGLYQLYRNNISVHSQQSACIQSCVRSESFLSLNVVSVS